MQEGNGMDRQLAGSATSQRCAAFLLLASLLTLGSCSPPPFDAAAEEAKLLRRDAEWAEVASAGKDVEKIVSYWSDDAVVMTVPGPDGTPMTLHGRGMTVWRLDPDGQWRCVVDIWNDQPPAAAAVKAASRELGPDRVRRVNVRRPRS